MADQLFFWRGGGGVWGKSKKLMRCHTFAFAPSVEKCHAVSFSLFIYFIFFFVDLRVRNLRKRKLGAESPFSLDISFFGLTVSPRCPGCPGSPSFPAGPCRGDSQVSRGRRTIQLPPLSARKVRDATDSSGKASLRQRRVR